MRALPLLLVPALALGATTAQAAPQGPSVQKSVTLADIALDDFQDVADDRGVLLGGIGSGLFHTQGNEYWAITDRGPNGEVGDARTFIVPDFTPALVRLKEAGGSLKVEESIDVVTPDGTPVTGLPNFAVAGDPAPLAADAVGLLDYNPNGLDTEGVVRTADGHFWVVDEYGPSILEIDVSGHVVERHVPAGLVDDYVTAGVDYPVKGSLPADLSTRRGNRGFEDIALLPDGKTLVVALQSSLVVAGDRDRIITELVEFDTESGSTIHVYPYRFDAATTFAAGTRGRDLKISALIPLRDGRVVVQERTDLEARFHIVNLDATDPLITEEDKTLLVNLAGIAGVPGKIEGAALLNQNKLVVISDNDFGFVARAYADGEDIEPSGIKTTLVHVKLP